MASQPESNSAEHLEQQETSPQQQSAQTDQTQTATSQSELSPDDEREAIRACLLAVTMPLQGMRAAALRGRQ